jgi:hypothetical protein
VHRAAVVGPVALADGALRATAIVRMLGQPRAELRRIAKQLLTPRRVLLGQRGLVVASILGAMPREHRFGSTFHLGGLPFEVGAGAAPRFGGIAGQLHAVDGKHWASDQPLPITHRQDRRKDGRDLVSQRLDKVRDGGEVWSRIPACRRTPKFPQG